MLAVAAIGAHAAGSGDAGGLSTARVLVRARPGTQAAELVASLAAFDAVLERIVTPEPLRVVLRAGSGEPRDARRLALALVDSGLAAYAVRETFRPMELRSGHVPSDPLFPTQWPLENTGQGGRVHGADVGAPEAWRYTLGSPSVTIAVLDDGVQLDHPDLAPNIASPGRDFTVDPSADGGYPRATADRHGTAVAGVAAARGDNALGVTGVCPRCTILPVRVYGSSNIGTADAFRYAVEQGASIITNSWGYRRPASAGADDAVRDAIESAARDGRGGRGTFIVFGMTNRVVDNCAAGHADISSLDSVVAVGVSDHNDLIGGSGFGPCMDLVAPARPQDSSTIGVTTTDRTGIDGYSVDDYYSSFGGTSAAAPLVAGIAGLLLSLNPDLTRSELTQILEETADKIDPADAAYDASGFSDRAGFGRVNAGRAVVPSVRIRVLPSQVSPGEPFQVIVSASAPFGLEAISWRARGSGLPAFDAPHERAVHGTVVASATWWSVAPHRPGAYTLEADADDQRAPLADDGYPHRASGAAPAPHAQLTVVQRTDGVSR